MTDDMSSEMKMKMLKYCWKQQNVLIPFIIAVGFAVCWAFTFSFYWMILGFSMAFVSEYFYRKAQNRFKSNMKKWDQQ